MSKEILSRMRKARQQTETENQTRRGFWFVKGDRRVFISTVVDLSAFARVCDSELSTKNGFDYWVDYCHGADIHGNPAWSNIDQTELFA